MRLEHVEDWGLMTATHPQWGAGFLVFVEDDRTIRFVPAHAAEDDGNHLGSWSVYVDAWAASFTSQDVWDAGCDGLPTLFESAIGRAA